MKTPGGDHLPAAESMLETGLLFWYLKRENFFRVLLDFIKTRTVRADTARYLTSKGHKARKILSDVESQ